MKDTTPDQNRQTRLNLGNECSDSPYPPPSLNDTCADDILKKLSRRKWLRDSAITATGAVLLPSFLTGCRKDVWDIVKGQIPNGGLGSVPELPLTPAELKAAADNINRMRALIADLYSIAYKYDEQVFNALDSTVENDNWANFIVDIFIEIGLGIASALLPEFAMPAIALFADAIKDWTSGPNRPTGLKDFFSTYQTGQIAMAKAIDEKLGDLTDENRPYYDYANLQAAWKDNIVFNGKTYTIRQLASSYFPEKQDNAIDYYKIFDPMYLHHRKAVWNLAIMKCCQLYRNYREYPRTPRNHTPKDLDALREYAQNTFYKQNPGVYLRANLYQITDQYNEWELIYWNLGIDKYPFPPAAIKELFIDDTPGHIINPDGLFNRSYVFQQFNVTKPDFSYWGHELSDRDPGYGPFAANDDWNFTGGLFPQLTDQ